MVITDETTNGARHKGRAVEDRESTSQFRLLVPVTHEKQNSGLLAQLACWTL